MKKPFHILLLFVLPLLFIILCMVCKNSAGEFYLNYQYDPSYVYLLNSLNLSQLNNFGVGRIIHHCGYETELKDFLETIKSITNKQNVAYKKVFQNSFGEPIYEIIIDSN